MAHQTEQMKKMSNDLDDIGTELQRARKVVTKMLTNTARSKTMWILLFMFILLVGVAIALKLT